MAKVSREGGIGGLLPLGLLECRPLLSTSKAEGSWVHVSSTFSGAYSQEIHSALLGSVTKVGFKKLLI